MTALATDAARLEALGEQFAPYEFRGHPLTVPLNLEAWPLQLLRSNPLRVVDLLLAGQDAGELPVVDDYRELSDAMAEAVGVSRLPETPAAPDQWFGGIPTLVELLNNHEDDLASDLRQFWGVRYADRFTGGLTLREIWTYLRRLPPTSAIARAKNGGREVWTEHMFVTASVYQAITGRIYPGRPLTADEVAKALEAMQAESAHVARLKERQAHYSTPAPQKRTETAVSAMEQAMANRRRELGDTATHGHQEN